METGLHFVGGETGTLPEEALISATEINPASEADLKALTPQAQTPNCALLGASVAALASHTTGLCHTCVLCCSILSHRDSREKRSVCRETEQHHLSSF